MTNLQSSSTARIRTAHKRYLAEGAANAFFTTRRAAVNPTDVSTQVAFKFFGQDGLTSSLLRTLPARSRMTVEFGPNDPAPTNDFSTVIESEQPLIVDRTMTWGRHRVRLACGDLDRRRLHLLVSRRGGDARRVRSVLPAAERECG